MPCVRRILVVRLDHIGDFVCTSPVFRNLKKEFPQAEITAVVNSASKEMAYKDPAIDKVITYSPFYLARGEKASRFKGLLRVIKDVRNIGFDLGLDPRGDLVSILVMWLGGVKYRVGYGITGGGFLLDREARYDSSAHVMDRNLALLKEAGVSVTDRTPAVYYDDKDAEIVEELLKGFKGDDKGISEKGVSEKGKWIVLHPFAGAKSKEWPIDRFQELIGRLKNIAYDILLVGSKNDPGVFENVVDLRGKLSLPQLAYLVKRARLFTGLDSGPANIAAALNVPCIIICSGTNIPQLWIPDNSNVRFVYKDVDCKPCGLKTCRKARHECMDSISVDDVIDEIKKVSA
jgi:heptosyltransferase-2